MKEGVNGASCCLVGNKRGTPSVSAAMNSLHHRFQHRCAMLWNSVLSVIAFRFNLIKPETHRR